VSREVLHRLIQFIMDVYRLTPREANRYTQAHDSESKFPIENLPER